MFDSSWAVCCMKWCRDLYKRHLVEQVWVCLASQRSTTFKPRMQSHTFYMYNYRVAHLLLAETLNVCPSVHTLSSDGTMALTSARGDVAGDVKAAVLRPSAPDSEAEMDLQSAELSPFNSDAPSASYIEPHGSSDSQDAETPDPYSAAPSTQPDYEDAESAHHESYQLRHLSPAKVQQLLSWLAEKRWSSRSTDNVSQRPGIISSAPEQPAESEHTSLAESAQLHQAQLPPGTDAESAQTESEDAESYKTGASSEEIHMPLLPAVILPGVQIFLLTAASLLAAWLVSSLLIRWLATPLTRPTAVEAEAQAQTPLEQEEEQASPEAAHSASEDAEEERQRGEQGLGLAIRARSVARSMSEAVSGLLTNGSETHEAEEAGVEAESAPRGSGAGTSRRGRQPRGRRELAALGECPQLFAAGSHHSLFIACAVAHFTADAHHICLFDVNCLCNNTYTFIVPPLFFPPPSKQAPPAQFAHLAQAPHPVLLFRTIKGVTSAVAQH